MIELNVTNLVGGNIVITTLPPVRKTIVTFTNGDINEYSFVGTLGMWSFDYTIYDMGMWLKPIQSIIIGDEITAIASDTFNSASTLEEITIGRNIQKIGQNAFYTYGSSVSVFINKTTSEVENMGVLYDTDDSKYENWGLPSGSSIVCTNGTIQIT